MNKTVIIVTAFLFVVSISVWRVVDTRGLASEITQSDSVDVSAEAVYELAVPYYYFDSAYDAVRCNSPDCAVLEDVPRKYNKDKEHTIIVSGEISYKDEARRYAHEKRARAFSCVVPDAGSAIPICEAQELLFTTAQSGDVSAKVTLVNWPTIDPLAGRISPLEVITISPNMLVARQHTRGDRSGIEYRLDRKNGTIKMIDFWYEGDGERAVYHYVPESEQMFVK